MKAAGDPIEGSITPEIRKLAEGVHTQSAGESVGTVAAPSAERPASLSEAGTAAPPADAWGPRDALLMELRGNAWRMQTRINAIIERDGKDGAVTGPGISIGYLLALDVAKALKTAGDWIEGAMPAEPVTAPDASADRRTEDNR